MSEVLNGHGTIEGIFEMKGGAAGKGKNVKIGGVYYTSWSHTKGTKGDTISFKYEEKESNGYTNRVVVKNSIEVVGGSEPNTNPATINPAPSRKPDNVQAMIVAQNSLTNATHLVIAFPKEFNIKSDNITSTVLEVAAVLAKKVLAGDFYTEPEFDDNLEELFKEKK